MHFAQREDPPVQVDDVIDFLRSLGVADEIYFFDVDIDTTILKGVIEHWEYPVSENGTLRRVADINTAKSLPTDWKRLVQCKEILHVIDPDHFRVNTFEATEALINDIVIPADVQDERIDEGVYAESDRWAVHHAVATLFPLATRNMLMGPYRTGKIDLDYIANLIDLPKYWVAKVMGDEWEDANHRMIRPQRIAPPDRVSFLKSDDSTIEVHSVPIGWDPYSYARHMLERQPKLAADPVRCLIERRGHLQVLSKAEIEARFSGR